MTQNLLFRRLLVDAVVAISLAKPSKPADEEKFALLVIAGSCRRLPRRASTDYACADRTYCTGRGNSSRYPAACSCN
jgi:hypothetical protein